MPTQEEILLTILGKDEATPVFNQITNNARSMGSNMRGTFEDSAGGLADSYMSAIGSVSTALSELNVGMMSLNSVNHQLMGSLGATKSASELVFGTSAKAETNKVLVQGWGDAKVSAEELYDTVDKVTDTSLTSMQDLIPAMNAFRAATSATGTELKESVAENMAQFGAYVLTLTGSDALAKTAMSDLSKGIKGRWASLDQYGVSEDALLATGKWSGDEDDIKGYMEAVRQVSGAVEELMNTSAGADALLGKMWSRAGKRIGNEYLPGITSIKRAFMDLDNELEGNLSTTILAVSLAIEQLSGGAYKFSTLVNGFRDMSKVIYSAGQYLGFFGSMMSAEEELAYYNAMATQQNTQEIDNNTMARYDNIDAMYQQADAMALLNDATVTNDGVMATNALTQSSGLIGNNDSNTSKTGPVSGLDYNYYMDLLASNPNAKLQPSRKEYDAIMGSLGGEIPRMSTNIDDRIGQILYLDDKLKNENSELKRFSELVDGNHEDLWTINALLSSYDDEINEINKTQSQIWKTGIDFNASDESIKKALQPTNNRLSEISEEKERLYDTVANLKKNDKNVNIADALDDLKLKSITDEINTMKIDRDDAASKTLSQAIKQKGKGITDGILSGLDSIKSIPGKIGGGLKSAGSSLASIPGRITGAFSNINGQSIKNAFNSLDKKLYDPFRDTSKLEVPDVDIGKKVKPVVKSAEEVAEVGMAAGAVAPEMAEASAGLSFLGLAEMGLVGAFTTLIVPTLAIAAVIAILIPIIAGLAMEAMFFLKVVMEFFDSLNFGDADYTSSIEGLKQIATALGYVALAVAALLAVNIVTTIVGPFMLISQIFSGTLTGTLDIAISALKQAASKIKEFSNIQIDPSIATNLGSLADALNGISKAMLSLTSIQIVDGISQLISWLPNMKDVGTALTDAKETIISASGQLEEFSGITPIDEGTATKIQNVCNTLGSIGDAFSGLQKIRDGQNFDILGGLANIFGGASIQDALLSVKQDIVDASGVLNQFSDVEPVDENIAKNVKSVADSLGSIGDAVDALSKLRDSPNKLGTSGQQQGGLLNNQKFTALESLKEVRNQIKTAAKGLAAFQDMEDVSQYGIPAKLKGFTSALNSISKAVTGMTNIQDMGKGKDFTQMAFDIRDVRRAIITVSKGLDSMAKDPNFVSVDETLNEKINSVAKAVRALKKAQNSLTNFPKTNGQEDDLVGRSVTTIRMVAGHFKRFNAKDKVSGSKISAINSINKGARSVRKVMNALKNFPKTNGKEDDVVGRAVTTVRMVAQQLRRLSKGDKVSNVSGALSSIRKAVSELRKTLNETKKDFKSTGKGIGSGLKSGVKQGLNGLDNVVSDAVSQAGNVGKKYGYTYGQGIGDKMKQGFDKAFDISTVVQNEMTEVSNAITGASGGIVSAIGQLAADMVEEFKNNAETKSPGAIARTVKAEMDYSTGFVNTRGQHTVSAVGNIARRMTRNFNPDLTGNINPRRVQSQVDSLRNINRRSTLGKSQRPVSIHIGEGAVQLDARNMTTKESRQVMISALEGLDMVSGIQIRGN